jgi:hypothetical protein
MKHQILFTLAICVLATQFTWAEEVPQPWNRHQGFYVEGDAGTNLVYLGVVAGEWAEAPAKTGGFAWHVAGGYAFNEHHALEAGFMQNYAWYDTEAGEEKHTVSAHANVAYAAWRPTLPIKDRVSVFGKLGLMYVWVPGVAADNTEVEVNGASLMAPYTGIGVSYAVTPQIELSVQYQGAIYVIAGAGAVTGGLTYHF